MRVPTMAPADREATAHCEDKRGVRPSREKGNGGKQTNLRLDVREFMTKCVADVGESSTDAGSVPAEKETGETALYRRRRGRKGRKRRRREGGKQGKEGGNATSDEAL
jgi:hypothetical protein